MESFMHREYRSCSRILNSNVEKKYKDYTFRTPTKLMYVKAGKRVSKIVPSIRDKSS